MPTIPSAASAARARSRCVTTDLRAALPSLLLLGLTQCASRPPTPPVAAPRAPVAAAEPPLDRLVDGATDAWYVGEDGGAVQVVVGGRRATVRGARVEWSSDRLIGPIVHVGRNARGWVFVGADGLVVRSGSFLGPLERVGEVPYTFNTAARPPRFFQPRPPLVLGAGTGQALWMVPDDGEPAPMGDVPLPIARAFLVVDAQTRVAVLPDGQVARTADGGRTWASVDVGDLVGDGLAQQGDEVLLQLRPRRTLTGMDARRSARRGRPPRRADAR